MGENKQEGENLNNELEEIKNENNQLKSQLIELSKKLKESEEFKSNFFSNITNEIINPFTSIIAAAESILLAEHLDWPRTFNLISVVHNESLGLDLLLKNFLNAAKIEAGDIKIDYCKTNIFELLNNIGENFSSLARKKQIKININNTDDLQYFVIDPEKFKLIITNLLFLAIEYSLENVDIAIIVTYKDNKLEIKFNDQGNGISTKYHKLIYDKFNNPIDLKKIGTYHMGFSLIVCRSILELMDGKMELDRNATSDTVFTITFPEQIGEISGISEGGEELIF